MTGDYVEQKYGCPFDSFGCGRCIWNKSGCGCDLIVILRAARGETP